MPLDPYFSAGKLAWLLEHDEAVARARDAGTLRLGTVDSFLCDRLGAGFATDPATASRTQLGAPDWDPALLDIFGVPRRVAAGDHGHRRRPRHAAPLLVAGRAAAARALPRPAGGAGRRGLRGARPGQGHLRDRRVRARPRRRRAARARAAASCRRSPGASQGSVEWAIDGGVFTAGALLEWLSRDLGLAADPAALAAAAAEVEDAGGVRVLPALAGRGRAVVAARGARRRWPG